MEPAPRRVRAMLAGRVVLDTTRAVYLWEWPPYPQYYIPLEDVAADVVVDENHEEKLSRGTARLLGLRAGGVERAAAGRVYTDDSLPGLAGLARFDWDAFDAWYEEDEEVFVHPRNPYAGSTPSGPPGTCGSNSTASCSPSRPARCCCSRPGCRRATTSTGPR
jgi:hypothetical protein